MTMLRKLFHFTLIFTLVFLLFSCNKNTPTTIEEIKASNNGEYTVIKPKVAKSFIDIAETENAIDDGTFIVVDVRTYEEFQGGHLEHAINIPNETITDHKPYYLPDEDSIILVYCRTGNRSSDAAKKLIAMGYRYVFDMQGGIRDWPYEKV